MYFYGQWEDDIVQKHVDKKLGASAVMYCVKGSQLSSQTFETNNRLSMPGKS